MLSSSTGFPCEKCGSCCVYAGCSHLLPDKSCAIYNSRPTVCRVDAMITSRGWTKLFGYALNKHYCIILRERTK